MMNEQKIAIQNFQTNSHPVRGAFPPEPLPGHCPLTPSGAFRWALDPTHDGSCTVARLIWVSPAASTVLTGPLSKITNNFKILAKAL